MKLTDEALRLAARQVCRAMADALPAPEDCDHQFSPAFHRKMRPLLHRRSQHPILRRIAAVLLAAFVGFGAWLLVDSDARAGLLRWVKEVYDTHIVYRFFGAPNPAADPAAWAPTWLPQGYEEMERRTLQGETLTLFIYKHPNGNIISFTCGIMQLGTAGMVIPENAVEEEVAVSDLPGFFYADPTGSNENLLIWTDEIHCLNFSLQSYEDQSVMLHIAESVKSVK